jgi:hypothetical protein
MPIKHNTPYEVEPLELQTVGPLQQIEMIFDRWLENLPRSPS